MLPQRLALVLLVEVLSLVVSGCDADVSCVAVNRRAADPTVDDGEIQCEVETITHARLPAIEPWGVVVQTCTNCPSHSCEAYGEPCDAFLAPCMAGADKGLCKSCCDDGVGVLRCARVIDATSTD